MDIINRAAPMFDELTWAVVNASVRKNKTLFTGRGAGPCFIEAATSHLPNVRVETFDKLLVDYAREQGAMYRSSKDCARSRTSSTNWR